MRENSSVLLMGGRVMVQLAPESVLKKMGGALVETDDLPHDQKFQSTGGSSVDDGQLSASIYDVIDS